MTWAALRFGWAPRETRRQRVGDLFAVFDGATQLARETEAIT